MRLLDRYVLRELLTWFFLFLGSIVVLWTSIEMLGEVEDFNKLQLTPSEVLEFLLYRVVTMIGEVVMPFSFLLATLWAMTRFARFNELTAMRAAGISVVRICIPCLATGFVLSLTVFWLNERLAPNAYHRMELLMEGHSVRAEDADPDSLVVQDFDFSNESADRIWKIGRYNLETGEMHNVWIRQGQPDGTVRFLRARTANYQEGTWVLSNTLERIADSPTNFHEPKQYASLKMEELNETPEMIASEFEISRLSSTQASKRSLVSLRTLRHYFVLHPNLSGRRESLLKTQFHARLATPWMCLVVVLIAIPFAVPSGRRNLFLGVTASLFIGFAYFILLRLGLSLGVGGKLPPWLAAWLPNLFFTITGLILIQRVR